MNSKVDILPGVTATLVKYKNLHDGFALVKIRGACAAEYSGAILTFVSTCLPPLWIFHFNRPTVALYTGHDSDENGPIVLMTTGPIKLN